MTVRDCFFETVYSKTREGEDIVIVSSDLGAPSLDNFRKFFPNRFVNVGIAEQNAIAVAAGLQVGGKTVITYGLNPFPVTRAFDQLRNLVASLQIPVTVTALNAGSCSADAGYTHVAIENLSLTRTLHGLEVFNPTDETIAQGLVNEILNNPRPRYVQFDKQLKGALYKREEIDFTKGFITNQVESEEIIVAYGITAALCMQEFKSTKVIDCFKIPFDENSFIEEIKKAKRIITAEDGVLQGGVGSLILELMNDNGISKPVKRYGLSLKGGYPEAFINRDLLWEYGGISLEGIKASLGDNQ